MTLSSEELTFDFSKPLLFEIAWEVANKGNICFFFKINKLVD